MTNKRRITKAAHALEAYYDEDDLRSPVVDLLTDLRHYCRKHRIDFDKASKAAGMHYDAEQSRKNTHEPIPADFPVQPLKPGEEPEGKTTCGHCGLSWDDDKQTSLTPAPSARCPFEYFHVHGD